MIKYLSLIFLATTSLAMDGAQYFELIRRDAATHVVVVAGPNSAIAAKLSAWRPHLDSLSFSNAVGGSQIESILELTDPLSDLIQMGYSSAKSDATVFARLLSNTQIRKLIAYFECPESFDQMNALSNLLSHHQHLNAFELLISHDSEMLLGNQYFGSTSTQRKKLHDLCRERRTSLTSIVAECGKAIAANPAFRVFHFAIPAFLLDGKWTEILSSTAIEELFLSFRGSLKIKKSISLSDDVDLRTQIRRVVIDWKEIDFVGSDFPELGQLAKLWCLYGFTFSKCTLDRENLVRLVAFTATHPNIRTIERNDGIPFTPAYWLQRTANSDITEALLEKTANNRARLEGTVTKFFDFMTQDPGSALSLLPTELRLQMASLAGQLSSTPQAFNYHIIPAIESGENSDDDSSDSQAFDSRIIASIESEEDSDDDLSSAMLPLKEAALFALMMLTYFSR